MNGPWITILLGADRDSGLIVASLPRATPYRMGERLLVGDVRCWCPDGTPPDKAEWQAWLWPAAGGDLAVTQSCKAVTARDVSGLRDRLQKVADTAPWWTVPDGRCTEVLAHGGRTSRCEVASAVAHDVHRNGPDGVAWSG